MEAAPTTKATVRITLAELRVGDRITRLGWVPNPGIRVVQSVKRVEGGWTRYTFTVENNPGAGVLYGSGADDRDLDVEVGTAARRA